MPTAADRIAKLEGKVQYLELREQLLTGFFDQAQKTAQVATHRAELELANQRTENARTRDDLSKLRDEFADFRVSMSAEIAVHKMEIGELKKQRELWALRW
jgi:septum formation topological specificity factor MinE